MSLPKHPLIHIDDTFSPDLPPSRPAELQKPHPHSTSALSQPYPVILILETTPAIKSKTLQFPSPNSPCFPTLPSTKYILCPYHASQPFTLSLFSETRASGLPTIHPATQARPHARHFSLLPCKHPLVPQLLGLLLKLPHHSPSPGNAHHLLSSDKILKPC